MAKKQIQKYVFTPTNSSITFPGAWTVEKILLITNVTRGVIMFNFADTANTGGTISFTPGGILSTQSSPVVTYGKNVSGINGTAKVQYESSAAGGGGASVIQGVGETTLTFTGSSVVAAMGSMSATDKISILVEEPYSYVRPWEGFGTDAVERARVAAPQSLIDADFEYGLQPTKWGSFQLVNQYPSVYEAVTPDLTITSITTDCATTSNIVVNSTAHGLSPGDPITVNLLYTGVTGFGKAQGSFLVFAANTNWFTYYAKGNVGPVGGSVTSLLTPNSQLRKGGLYTGAALNVTRISSDGATPSKITVTFGSAHGFVPGMPLLVNANPNFGSNTTFLNLPGSYYTSNITSTTTAVFTARGQIPAGTYPGSGAFGDANGNNGSFALYARPDGYFTSRPGDGGVILGTASAIHGALAARQTKKYFRYQSGKGYMYTTGVLFAPNYDIVSIGTGSALNLAYPGYITCTVSVPHGLQIGAVVRVVGVNTPGYDGEYTVARVDNEYTIQFQIAQGVTIGQGSTQGDPQNGIVNAVPKLFVYKWHGACIRTGPHDDTNGMFVEYDGLQFNCVKRTSTLQLAGAATFTPNSNTVTGDGNCLWTQQLRIGDKIVLKGMVHRVSLVTDNNTISVTPDYRGISTVTNNYIWKVVEERAAQVQFNTDTVDGSASINNPSGYKLDPTRVQMILIAYTWYGAGFMDFGVRGLDGNYIIMHRMKQNNVNTTASMRSANLPARYTVVNEGANTVTNIPYVSSLAASGAAQIPVDDATFFPDSGIVLVDSELISYSAKNTTPGSSYLVINQRAATSNVFIGGQYYLFGGGAPATHNAGTGVELVSLTASPTMSHWGSAYIADGGFDYDRGYQFTYTVTNANVVSTGNTVMGLRLSPSASNSITGDLGDRDLLNRAQILLNKISINVGDKRTGGNVQLLVTGMLNPANYSEASQTWTSLNNANGGNQPSFAQVTANCWFTTSTYVGQPSTNATPGEKLFEFVSDPMGEITYDLSGVKELSQSGIGGRGTYPNGSDTLYIIMQSLPGAVSGITGATTVNTFLSNVHVTLQWAEAQA